MLVYGDHDRSADARAVLARMVDALAAVHAMPAGIDRHGALVSLFIEASELAQGLADAAFEAAGEDDDTPANRAAMGLLMAFARSIASSWDSGFRHLVPVQAEALLALAAQPLPAAVRMRQAEGHAFYAVYPEAYLESARRLSASLPRPVTVIGLRSIGIGLAAMAAVGLGAGQPVTLRPVGHPFRRALCISARLGAALTVDPAACSVVVDEGPGLSGSSFGAVADWLEERGVPRGRIAFLPSHDGDLGPEASPAHRRRWSEVNRSVVPFDTLFRSADGRVPPLERWFEDRVGPPVAPLQSLSGGEWRSLLYGNPAAWPPVHAQQERCKYLLRTESGTWLLKFAGLGRAGEAKLERARTLHRAGFVAEPVALRHGFLAERWLDDARPLCIATPELITHLAEYLLLRARSFPVDGAVGADLPALLAMARVNLTEALGEPATLRLARWTPDVLGRLGSRIRRIVTDNRLHLWEWLRCSDGRLLKADALDHACAHDRIGCQDVAWDVAGGIVEFGLSAAEATQLCHAVGNRMPLDLQLVDFCIDSYIAFQIGYWSFAAAFDDRAVSALSRYRAAWRRACDEG
ncbi:hypothetical protein [Azospirillum melinis]